jgi:hypothetical protein
MPAGLPQLPLHIQPWALMDDVVEADRLRIESELDRMRLLFGRAGIQVVARPIKRAWDDSWEKLDRRALTQISASLFTSTQAAVNCVWVSMIHEYESDANYSTHGFAVLADSTNGGSWAAFAALGNAGGPNTMAHELGHVLGLPHIEEGASTTSAAFAPFPDDVSSWDEAVDGKNLMSGTYSRYKSDVVLSPSQVRRLRLSVVSGVVPYAAYSSSSSEWRPLVRVGGAAVAGAVLA